MFEIKNLEEKMKKNVNVFKNELEGIKAGRANPKILDKILADNYGSLSPISQMANITVPEARILQISPWDSTALKSIEKAILTSDLGINPSNDGKIIRLVFPELTEERRKDLSKEVKKKGEDAKIGIRNIRREGVDEIEALKKKSILTEDDLKRDKEKIQKSTDKFILEIDKIIEDKSKEIMSV